MGTDLLLLNATNLPWRPIFPYAFVQVSAVARRHGLRVKTLDLLGILPHAWPAFLRTTLAEHQPRLIGLHIRQSDSVFLDDYYSPPGVPPATRNYFPIHDNRVLVDVLRAESPAKIIAGGIGYTTHARQLFDHLGIDLGSQGDPDDIFARFDDVIAGRDLGTIKSLIYRDGENVVVNDRGYFDPSSEPEWTDELFDEMVRFYGHAQLFGSNPPTVPVEVMRGCPFRCYFCTEPFVKGKAFRFRDLDAVEADVDFLMRRHIRRFWFVCSELDVQGPAFGLQLAERMIKLRERHGGTPVEWSAYALPRLTEGELRTLQRAGYSGALNDVLSLDDVNLKAARVPYRSGQAVAFLKAVTKLDREDDQSAANAASAESKVAAGLTQRTPKELAATVGMFLGNAHISPTTISTTLRRFDDEHLTESYRMGLPFASTRVFAPNGEPIIDTSESHVETYGANSITETIDIVNPTFAFPAILIERLKTPAEIVMFMRYVGETFMSTGHRRRKDWAWFLGTHTTLDAIAMLVGTDAESLRWLFAPPPPRKAEANQAAAALLDRIVAEHAGTVARVSGVLGIADPAALSEYRLGESLSKRFATTDDVIAEVTKSAGDDPFAVLYAQWLLHSRNVVLRPEYSALLFA